MDKETLKVIGDLSLENFFGAKKVPTPDEIIEQDIWIDAEIERIGIGKLQILIQAAVEIRPKARCELSGYAVGAAVLWNSGRVDAGFNIEDPTYTLTEHAETMGMKKGIGEKENAIEAIAVCHAGESQSCGICRQYMTKFQENVLVIAVDPEGKPFNVTSLQILLPYAFSGKQLEEQQEQQLEKASE